MIKTIIAYSLYFQEILATYLPEAYYVQERPDQTLGYMVARVVPKNIASYGIAIAGSPHEKLFDICQQLRPKSLEEKYSRQKRKRRSLQQINEDPKAGILLKKFVQRKMGDFLQAIRQANLPLCIEIKRQLRLEQVRLSWAQESLLPMPHFIKMAEGIAYTLQLSKGSRTVIPQNENIQILLDDPGYLLIDDQIYTLKHINGNKIKPFLKRKEILIPNHLTKTYFEKFILEMAHRVEIEAEGFDIQQFDDIRSISASFTEDFIRRQYVLDLIFYYGETYFYFSDTSKRRNRLVMDEDGQVTIKQFTRSDTENKVIQNLLEAGLSLNMARRLILPENGDRFAVIEWVINHRDLFESLAIKIKTPVIDGHMTHLEPASLNLYTTTDQDWFDIKGHIEVGGFMLSFADLLESIRLGDPLFILPNQEAFIIPAAWMSTYRSLATFGIRNGEGIKIKKSQYTVVEETEVLSQGVRKIMTEDSEIDYETDPQLKGELRPYQLEGVKWLLKHQANGLGACLADDMGLGKTIQTLAVLSHTKAHLQSENRMPETATQLSLFLQEEAVQPLRALILLPATLVFNWVEEIKKFCPHFEVGIYLGTGRETMHAHLHQFDVVLTTYQTALRDIEVLREVTWKYIVLDESHMIKNKESKIFKAVNTLITKNKISLSGTPIENSLSDLWSQMQFINPDLLGTYTFFKEQFLIPIQKYQDQMSLEQLRSLVEPFILRRRKEEVAKDLPEITEQVEYVPMTSEQEDLFEKEKSAARNELLSMSEHDSSFNFHVFRSLLRLRQISNHPVLLDAQYAHGSGKFNQVLEHLHSILKARHKVLVFSSFTSHLNLFAKKLKELKINYCLLTGKTSQQDRKVQVDSFQNDLDFPVFLISLRAGGTGLNLTRADYVFILDPWWNPFVEKQAIGRAHRIGREHPISVIRFISKNSIEEKIIRLQAKKKVLAAELIDDQDQISLAKHELHYLLE